MKLNNCKVISIDIETLALTPDAVVLSFGAQCIDISNGVASIPYNVVYYEVLGYNDQLASRIVDTSTIDWWSQQGEEAQSVLAESKGRASSYLASDLEDFVSWIEDIKGEDDMYLLAKDPDFDGTILNHLFAEHGLVFPFDYNKRIALRTMGACYELVECTQDAPKTEPEVAHNALSDAVAQAKDFVEMYEALMFAADILEDRAP